MFNVVAQRTVSRELIYDHLMSKLDQDGALPNQHEHRFVICVCHCGEDDVRCTRHFDYRLFIHQYHKVDPLTTAKYR